MTPSDEIFVYSFDSTRSNVCVVSPTGPTSGFIDLFSKLAESTGNLTDGSSGRTMRNSSSSYCMANANRGAVLCAFSRSCGMSNGTKGVLRCGVKARAG